MTAKIIKFPVAEQSAEEGSVVWRGKTRWETIAIALHWDELGLTLEDIPADTRPRIRRLIELMLGAPANRDSGSDSVL